MHRVSLPHGADICFDLILDIELFKNDEQNAGRYVVLLQRVVKLLRPSDADTDSLFLTKQKTPIKNATIARIFKTVKVTKVGEVNLTRRIYPHLLRHTFATTYLENGGNIYALQQILGHTTLDMVKKYVHLTQAKTVVNFEKYSPLDNLGK